MYADPSRVTDAQSLQPDLLGSFDGWIAGSDWWEAIM